MKLKIFILCLLIVNSLFAQSDKELKTEIKEVTVFLKGAQVNRAGEVNITSGKTKMIIKNLSPYIDEKSVRVKAEGDFTILSVNHQYNYLSELKRGNTIDSLQKTIISLKNDIALEEGRLVVLKEKLSLLDKNKQLRGDNNGTSLMELKAAIDFYEKEIIAIKNDEVSVKNRIVEYTEQKSKIEKQIKEVEDLNQQPAGEIVIRAQANRPVKATFSITYLVSNAGWYPNYDVRAKDAVSPILLNYKADVYQNTGIDWNEVKLKFSNADPDQSGLAPYLDTWYLNYARNTIFQKNLYGAHSSHIQNVSGRVMDDGGQPIPGVNVLVKGTTIGTVTGLDGGYQLTLPNNATHLSFSYLGYVTRDVPITRSVINMNMQPDIQQLSEVVVTSYDVLSGKAPGLHIRGANSLKKRAETVNTTTIENQTTVEFEVDIPYTIRSNGEKISVDLKQHKIDAIYEYYAVPKLDKDAFLTARILNWDQYHLLEGEANLYFEDAYVGRTILEAKRLADTLSISLGRDKNIVLGRTKVNQFTKKRIIGGNKIETLGFQVLVRNKKSLPVQLTVYDQVPVSAINEIQVVPTELSGGNHDKKTGKIKWELKLDPNQQKELLLKYEVKYPKREQLALE